MQYIIKNDKVLVTLLDSQPYGKHYNGLEIIQGGKVDTPKDADGLNNLTRASLLSKLDLTELEIREQQRARLERYVREFHASKGVDAFFLMCCFSYADTSSNALAVKSWCDTLWQTYYHDVKADIISGASEVSCDFSTYEPVPFTFSEVRTQVGV
jgi:hypothetical protein